MTNNNNKNFSYCVNIEYRLPTTITHLYICTQHIVHTMATKYIERNGFFYSVCQRENMHITRLCIIVGAPIDFEYGIFI